MLAARTTRSKPNRIRTDWMAHCRAVSKVKRKNIDWAARVERLADGTYQSFVPIIRQTENHQDLVAIWKFMDKVSDRLLKLLRTVHNDPFITTQAEWQRACDRVLDYKLLSQKRLAEVLEEIQCLKQPMPDWPLRLG